MITEIQTGEQTRLELYEILDSISKEDPKSRVGLIRNYIERYSSFSDYVRCVFDKNIMFLLPDSRPPFTPAVEGAVFSSWHNQNRTLQYFVKGLNADKLNVLRRESMFIGMLESVHPADAEILIEMTQKRTPCEELTVETVMEAMPTLL